MGIGTSLAGFAPWKIWHSATIKRPPLMPSYEEDLDECRPILHLDITSPLSLSEPTPTQIYGSTHSGEGSSVKDPLPARRNSLLRVLEEDPSLDNGLDEEEDEEWELEKQGLYKGSYTRILALYTFVPLSSLAAFALFALLQVSAYPPQLPDTYPYPKSFPFPFPEVLASASLWSLSHLLRIPLHSVFFSLFASPTPAIIFSTLFHVMLHNLLRLATIPLLLLRHHMVQVYPTWHDPTFRRIWWIALGWSFAEVAVGVAQGYDQISLYRDVLVPEGRGEEFSRFWKYDMSPSSPPYFPPTNGTGPGSCASSSTGARYDAKGKSTELPVQTEDLQVTQNNGNLAFQEPSHLLLRGAPQEQVDRDLDRLMSLRGREELEEVYGIPAIRIPVFISCLLRFNPIILSLGITLIIAASYLRSRISLSLTFTSNSPLHFYDPDDPSTNRPFFIAFPIVIALNLFLALLHTPLILPRILVHTAAYIGLLVGLGCLFIGLGMWEVLS